MSDKARLLCLTLHNAGNAELITVEPADDRGAYRCTIESEESDLNTYVEWVHDRLSTPLNIDRRNSTIEFRIDANSILEAADKIQKLVMGLGAFKIMDLEYCVSGDTEATYLAMHFSPQDTPYDFEVSLCYHNLHRSTEAPEPEAFAKKTIDNMQATGYCHQIAWSGIVSHRHGIMLRLHPGDAQELSDALATLAGCVR